MKKILSYVLIIGMVLSSVCVVSAGETYKTTIRYVDLTVSEYLIKVPELMCPGDTADITVSGTWTSKEEVVIDAPSSVTLTNEIDGETKELGVDFDGIAVIGSNYASLCVTSPISIEEITDVHFGVWEGCLVYSVCVNDLSVPVIHNGIIPKGGTYYVNATSNSMNTGDYSYVGDYNLATAVYREGDPFPSKVNDGDVYVYGDYEYRYNYLNVEFWLDNPVQNGWGVRVLDANKLKYGVIIQEINNKPVTSLCSTFSGCGSIIKSPVIPITVVDMMETFGNSSLETAPIIPASVTNMLYTFINCDNLTGEVEINATNLTNYKGCFDDTELPIVLVGSNSKLVDIASKYANVTVKS